MTTITLHEAEYASLKAAKEQIIRDEHLRILDNTIRAMREIGNCEESLDEVMRYILPELARKNNADEWHYYDGDGLTVDGYDVDGVQDPGYRFISWREVPDDSTQAANERRHTRHLQWLATREQALKDAWGEGAWDD